MTTILHILQHALGRDQYGIQRKNGGVDYRNHFCADEGSDDFELCRKAVSDELMTERAPSVISGGSHVFIVTAKGVDNVALNSPAEPRLSRSAQRYRDYISADTGLSFAEYMGFGRSKLKRRRAKLALQ